MSLKEWQKHKVFFIITALMLALPSIACACLIPDRCIFSQQVNCKYYSYNNEGDHIILTIRLDLKSQYNNPNLKIDNCEQTDRKILNENETEFVLNCKPTKSDYTYPGFSNIFFPEFMSPCPSGIAYKKEIGLLDDNTPVASGKLFIFGYAEPPDYLSSLNLRLKLITTLSNFVPFVLLAVIIAGISYWYWKRFGKKYR
jgi:hypothetical protein